MIYDSNKVWYFVNFVAAWYIYYTLLYILFYFTVYAAVACVSGLLENDFRMDVH